MNILKVSPRGFCLGVVKSIKMAKEALKMYPNKDIYMIGLLVHNKNVVSDFESQGIKIIDDWKKSRLEIIKSIPKGSVVVFSAHGTDKNVVDYAQENGLIVIDTKCEWVLETENLINDYLKLGFEIIFIGKHNHPETIALTSINKEKIHLVTNTQEVENLNLNGESDIFVTNQTTLSIIDTQIIYEKIKTKYKNVKFKNDLCDATLVRQKAVLDLKTDEVDLLFVVGDERSNNTLKLVELAENKGIRSIRINSKNDIDLNEIKDVNTIAVTAGASTPSIIQNEVITYLESLCKP
ncbi:4-hydroxy-3-methylbut-2-enyl diphosphate reductase [Spiroplasma corruscae]|uniref:4-hydroxy-3-methylbut-2-enyl diphosphate reductase n=1 Tax=Spiroplasma corruscae TaxID=216934 RepID=A0A222ENI7_9MOLU|nr:4-hydroxy-3-methylbut-2-enyl diphosphate reductase [Spiroplasma corruscae]ASP28058.1 4-hydroxy-3-methylbut-2-enyl diphosphate reductase [Spiroplasma corruscae]